MSAATCSTALSVRLERKTVAPWAANSLATADPTAPPAPKMTARLFFNKGVDVDAVFITFISFQCLFLGTVHISLTASQPGNGSRCPLRRAHVLDWKGRSVLSSF